MFQNDPNRNHHDNFLWSSWNFRQLFDDLHTAERGVGIVLRFVGSNPTAEKVLLTPNRYESRYRVTISVEFQSALVATSFAAFFKNGTERVTDTMFRSFIFVKDVDVFQDCLRKKFMFEKVERQDPWLKDMEFYG
jgi:GTP cyclohydrolase I